MPTPARPDHSILPTIAIDIGPANTWPHPAELMRQERLTFKIVEGIILMTVPQPLTVALEKRGCQGLGLSVR